MSRILFLSSDPVLKEKNLETIRQSGLEAVGAAECLEGLVLLDKGDFSVVIIDDELSDMSGYEACLKVRQQTDVPIILLGTVVESEVWSKVEELGFDLYLRKPLSPRELLARLKALMRRPVQERRPTEQKEKPVASKSTETHPAAAPEAVPIKQKSSRPRDGHPRAEAPPPPPEPPPRATPVPPMQQVVQEPPVQRVPPQAQPIQQFAPGSYAPVESNPFFNQPPAPVQPVQPTPVPPLQPVTPPYAPQPVQPQYREQEPIVVPPLEREVPRQVIEQSATSYAQPVRTAQPYAPPVPVPEETGVNVLEDARIVKLVDALVNGKLADITPTVDFSFKYGFAYPAVDSLLDTSDQDTIAILDALAQNGILIKQPYEKYYVDPDGLFQLVPVEHCPRDDSPNLVKGQLIEHFSCGYVGLDRDFKQDSRYICPKCHKDLRLVGTDYRNVGIHYRCQDDGEVFTTPVIKWRNLKTRKEWNSEELKELEVYSYRFSPDKKGWLEFQLKPKTQLVDFLRLQGYQVHELAQLTGKSGAVHTFDVLAIRDDILTKINLGIGILVASTGESEVGLEALFRFDTRAYDIGINYKVVIAIPKLGPEAMNFANRQMIRAFEARTLATVVSDITHLPHSKVVLQSTAAAPYHPETSQASIAANAKTSVVRFLRNRGYEVYEKALIVGKSGIEHVFDIFARRDDKIIVPTIAIGMPSNNTGQPVGLDEISRFDAAAFDSGIRNKVFLALPQISVQARQFARQQRIDIFEQQDLGRLV